MVEVEIVKERDWRDFEEVESTGSTTHWYGQQGREKSHRWNQGSEAFGLEKQYCCGEERKSGVWEEEEFSLGCTEVKELAKNGF